MLLSSIVDEMDGEILITEALQVQGNSHPVGRGTSVIAVEFKILQRHQGPPKGLFIPFRRGHQQRSPAS